MLEAAVIVLRFLQYAGAMVLLGSSLFLLYALPLHGPGAAASLGWPRRILALSAGVLLGGTLLGLLAQTSVLAGSVSEGLKMESLSAVVTTMAMGPSSLVRAGAAAAALGLLVSVPAGRWLYLASAALGAIASASFAWMGHGAATQGPGHLVHLGADVLHLAAAALWVGALVMFFGLLIPVAARRPDRVRALHSALQGFAGVGSGIVAILVATGLVNSWILVGPSHLAGLWTTPYGQLLSLKLVLFGAMLGLAGANRFRLTPGLARGLESAEPARALAALRRSLLLETGLSLAVLAIVAWLGTLAPAASQ